MPHTSSGCGGGGAQSCDWQSPRLSPIFCLKLVELSTKGTNNFLKILIVLVSKTIGGNSSFLEETQKGNFLPERRRKAGEKSSGGKKQPRKAVT